MEFELETPSLGLLAAYQEDPAGEPGRLIGEIATRAGVPELLLDAARSALLDLADEVLEAFAEGWHVMNQHPSLPGAPVLLRWQWELSQGRRPRDLERWLSEEPDRRTLELEAASVACQTAQASFARAAGDSIRIRL